MMMICLAHGEQDACRATNVLSQQSVLSINMAANPPHVAHGQAASVDGGRPGGGEGGAEVVAIGGEGYSDERVKH